MMTDMQENYKRGLKTVAAWSVYGALEKTECKKARSSIIKTQLGYQKHNISSDELNLLSQKFEILSNIPNAKISHYKAVAQDRIPSDLTISTKDMMVLKTSSKQKTIV